MITTLHSDLLDRIKGTWSHDPNLVDLIRKLQQPTSKPSKFTWVNGQLRRIGKLVVGFDDALRKELLHLFHSSAMGGHSGAHQTISRICGVVYWKGLKKAVCQFVRECSVCQQCKYDTAFSSGLLQPLPVPDKVWTDIFMDFIEVLPKSS